MLLLLIISYPSNLAARWVFNWRIMTKQTLGSIVTDLSQKTTEKISIIDQQREMQKDYMKDLMQAIDRGYSKYPGDFFVHVETKAERLLANTYRNYFIDRLTCPTPNYDQSVFRYNRTQGEIEYIWTIPDRESSYHLVQNALEVSPEEKELLSFILKFADGTLFRLCKKLNGEKLDTPELIKE